MTKNFYITTPIYYVNGDPHLGHVYTTTAADVVARFKRLAGYDVHFLTGTDEHGQKVAQSAEKEGIAPQEFCDGVAQKFMDVLEPFQISNDDFIRTTEERHKRTCQTLWKTLEKAGDIYLDKYAGWYAVRDEAYYGEDELEDGPDKDTKIATATGAECKWVEEESYFFRLSNYGDKLLELYASNPDFIGPKSSYNEIKSFVEGGLKDLSISRTTFDWGVPVPGNDKHVMYVWIDALTNYITALGHGNDEADLMDKFWPADVHVVGKEITRFHAIYWPAFLMSANLSVPKRVYANGWWNGDLANGLGNLAQRSLSMMAKNAEGKIPSNNGLSDDDNTLLSLAYNLPTRTEAYIDAMQIHKYLDDVWHVVGEANAYIDAQAPWKLKKEDPDRMMTVLYVLAETIRCCAIMAQPIIPTGANKILDQVAVEQGARTFAHVSTDHALRSGIDLPIPQGVFPRLELNKEEAA